MAYIDKYPQMKGPELGGKFLANMNLDMVGENLELLHSKLILTRTPDSMPSVVNDVVENMAEMVDRMNVRTPRGSLSAFNFRTTSYSGGSDHMMFIEIAPKRLSAISMMNVRKITPTCCSTPGCGRKRKNCSGSRLVSISLTVKAGHSGIFMKEVPCLVV